MIIYNITIKANHEVADAFLNWLKTEHMADVISTGLFYDSRVCLLLEQDDTDGITYAVQFFCNSIDDYQTYIAHHADTMRKKGLALFGGKFAAFRTVLEVL